jgi:hypothetical protein
MPGEISKIIEIGSPYFSIRLAYYSIFNVQPSRLRKAPGLCPLGSSCNSKDQWYTEGLRYATGDNIEISSLIS